MLNLKAKSKLIVDLSMRTNYCPTHITQVELGIRRMSIDFLFTIANANTILNVNKKVDLAEELSSVLKLMSKKKRRKVINILFSIKESIEGEK